ncbi:MAG: hypothetical protein D6785_14100 [Planctomycetota bacterium]|nr:MAG: hypothetical protein D6785_14100 [Planctomycetota bacterium]
MVTKIKRSTFMKTALQAYKGLIEEIYSDTEKMRYLDLILSLKDQRIQKVRRSYYSYYRLTRPWGEKRPKKAVHFLEGTVWEITRKGKRAIVILKKGKVPEPAFQVVRLDDEAEILAGYLPKKPISVGYRWNLPPDAVKKLLGDDWKKGTKSTVTCVFLKKAFFKGFRVAKIGITQKVKGNHNFGMNAKMNLKGYYYYSLEYGFPIYFTLKGKMTLDVTQVAPRGQKASFHGEGPIEITIEKEYRPPENEED